MISSRKKIELQIDYHPSGNHTLKMREFGQRIWEDIIEDEIWANPDLGAFYKAVVRKIGNIIAEGNEIVNITDSTP